MLMLATRIVSMTTKWTCWKLLASTLEFAGAELLGRDVASVCAPGSLDQIRSLIKSEGQLERLTNHMIHSSAYPEAAAAVERIVNAFCRGVLKDL
jgi:predicted nucleotidyltransferase